MAEPTRAEIEQLIEENYAAGNLDLVEQLLGELDRLPKSAAPKVGFGDVKAAENIPAEIATPGAAKARLFMHGFSLETLPALSAAVDATFGGERAGSDPSWGNRFRMAKARNEAVTEQTKEAYPADAKIMPALGAIALGARAPGLSMLAGRVAPGMPLAKAAATRALAALGDMLAYRTVATVGQHAGEPAADVAQAAGEAATPRLDATTMIPLMAGAAETYAGPLARAIGRRGKQHAATQAIQVLDPTTRQIGMIEDDFGDFDKGGAWLRDARLHDGTPVVARGDGPRQVRAKLLQYTKEQGRVKGDITRRMDQQFGRSIPMSQFKRQIDAGPGVEFDPQMRTHNPTAYWRYRAWRDSLDAPDLPDFETFSGLERQARILGKRVHSEASAYPKPREAIKETPDLAAMSQSQGIMSRGAENAVEAGLGAGARADYELAKQNWGAGRTMTKVARAADRASRVPLQNRPLSLQTLRSLARARFLPAAVGGVVTGAATGWDPWLMSEAALGTYAANRVANAHATRARIYDAMSNKLLGVRHGPIDPQVAAALDALYSEKP